MRFFLSLISALQLLRYANEGFLTGPPQIVQLTGKGIERQLARNNNVSIGIIGAGFAGLSAYQRLVWHGFSNVHLLEASSRIGGRVFPLEFEGSFLHQGAEFINGEGNPIFEIAERLGLIEGQVDDAAMISSNAVFASTPGCQVPPDRLLDKFANFTAELELHYAELAAAVPQLWNVTIAELFDQDFAQFLERENSTSQLVRAQYESLARMYRSYYEGEWSAPIEKLALRNYAQWKDGTQSFPFSSYTLDARGYAPILEELGRGIPEEKLHLNSRVVNIDYRGPHIQLRLQRRKGEEVGKHGQRMWTDLPDHFDFVIVTVPIGHLKRFAPALFTPPLPALKRKAIDAIGFGAMQKVFLIYDRPFWPANMSSLVTLSCPAGRKGNGGHELIRQSLHTLQPHPWASARVCMRASNYFCEQFQIDVNFSSLAGAGRLAFGRRPCADQWTWRP